MVLSRGRAHKMADVRAIPGYKALVEATGAAVAMANEALEDTGDGLEWVVSNAAKSVWDYSQELTVEVDDGGGGGFQAVSPDRIRWLFGRVVFSDDQTGNDVRVTGHYLPRYRWALGREVNWIRSQAPLDATVFGDEDVQRIAGLQHVEASVQSLDIFTAPLDHAEDTPGEDTLGDLMDDRNLFVVSYQPDEDGDRVQRAVMMFASQAVSMSVTDIVQGDAAMEGAAPGDFFGNQVTMDRIRG